MCRMAWVARGWGVVLCGLLMAFCSSAGAASAPAQEIVGRYGGQGSGVAVNGNLVYYSEGDCLLVLDVSNRQNPKALNRMKLAEPIKELKVVGTALIGYGATSFQFFDLSQPAAPVLKSSLAGTFWQWAAEGKLICAIQDKDFTVIDFSDLLHPRVRSTSRPVGPGQSWLLGVAVASGRAYLLSVSDQWTTSGMSVVDLGNPDAPRKLGSKEGGNLYGWSGGIAVRNGMVFTNSMEYFSCFDARNPQAITLAGTVACISYSDWCQIVLNGDVAYVKSSYGVDAFWSEITVIDVSDPARMVNHGALSFTTSIVRQMDSQASWLYVATADGLLIENLANPLKPVQGGRFSSLGNVTGVALAAGRAYVAGDALTVFDISDARNPAPVVRSAISGLSGPLKLHNGFLYNLNSTNGLSIIDISKPDAPVLKGRIKTPGKAWNMALDGHYAWVADGATLQVVDITNPASPKLVTMPGGNPASARGFAGIAVRDGKAYLGDSEGLAIYDVSVVTAPRLLSRFTGYSAGSTEDIVLWKGLAIIGWGGYPYMMGVDISDPAKPRLLWQKGANDIPPIGCWWPTHSLYLRDGQLFFSTSGYRIELFDLQNPAAPRLASQLMSVNYWETTAEQSEASGPYEYIANGYNGFAIARYTNPYNAASPAWNLYGN